MKMVDREKVDGTGVFIGRRVIKRSRPDGEREERAYRSYTAEYKDTNGRWVSEGLGTTNRAAARRKAIEIAGRIEAGTPRARDPRITIDVMVERYLEFHRTKGLAPKSMSKYTADLAKLQAFCATNGPVLAPRFTERDFFAFKQWLEGQSHKQGTTYAGKTCYTTLTIVKQLFKWGWRSGLTPGYALAGVSLPSAKAKPQPCFTADQVEAILEASNERERAVFGILAYTGMRVNELVQLRWEDVLLDRGELGVLHIRRGGFSDQPKDKDERFVPIHPKVRVILESLPSDGELVIPGLRDRWVLVHVKAVCKRLGYGSAYKTHSFRHFFASMVANSNVPYRMALAWMGHSSSAILDLYYHLHDTESEAAMKGLASA